MSDASQGAGWWQAADGRWYPPRPADRPPAPGWWLATDGRWYPPRPADRPPAPGWWLATDGRWYPPAGQVSASGEADAKPARAAKKVVKKRVVKKVVKKVAAADDAARTDGEPAPVTRPDDAPAAPPQPVAGTATKAAAGRGAAARADRPKRPSDLASSDGPDAPKPGLPGRGLPLMGNEDDQIARQRQASRDDAEQLATARYAAAMKALSRLAGEDSSPAAAAAASEESGPSEPAPPAAAVTPGRGPDGPPDADVVSIQHPDRPLLDESPVLLELKMSALGADIDHIGDRMLIRSNRIELRDRSNTIRLSTSIDGVLGVHISKKLTGAVLTVTSRECDEIVAKGVRPDQAEEAQTLIGRLAPGSLDGPPQPPAGASKPTGDRHARVDEKDLLAKLSDLYDAGVLTTMEYEEKRELIARLARAEQFTAVSR